MYTKEKKVFVYVVMGIYLLFLCWLILFKLADSIDKIPSMRGINLIPFHYDQLSNTRFHKMEVLYNVLVFIPAGFFFSALGKRKVTSGIIVSTMFIVSVPRSLLQNTKKHEKWGIRFRFSLLYPVANIILQDI